MRHTETQSDFHLPGPMRSSIAYLLVLVLVAATPVFAAEKDNTGTNPINFTYDARFYSEMATLPHQGGSLITNTYELRWPMGGDMARLQDEEEGGLYSDMGKRAAFRVKARQMSLSRENPDESPFGTSEVSGIGDLDLRLMGIFHSSKSLLVAGALEASFDLASNNYLGSGKTLLMPVIFFVFPSLMGKGSLFAPGFQYVFDVGGDPTRDDVSRTQIDLYFVWLLAGGKNWLIGDPQVVFDHENDTNPGLFELEWGYMIAQSAGASTYVRPGVGIGPDRPYDWNLEVGLKFVWR